MSSPFSIFRKYQKSLLVIAGVLLMFVFVIGDSLTPLMRGSSGGTAGDGRSPTDVAVQWNGGQLTNQQLNRLVQRREITKAFLTRLYQAGMAAAYEAGADERLPISVQLVAGVNSPSTNIEQSVVQTRLLADAARQTGMKVSDEHIRHYLVEVGRGRISTDQMRGLLTHSEFQGGRIPIDYVFEALREELLAQHYFDSYEFAISSISPQQRWEDWLKVNDRITVEVAALPAQQYVVDVPEPNEEQLVAFYEEFKEREPLPEVVDNTELPSADPGFAIPRQVQIHFLQADFNQFITNFSDEVTDKEIEAYYEANKDEQFVKADADFDESFPFGEEATSEEPNTEEAAPTDQSDTNEPEQPPADDSNQPQPPAEESGQPANDETDAEVAEPTEQDESAEQTEDAEPGDAAEQAEEEEEEEAADPVEAADSTGEQPADSESATADGQNDEPPATDQAGESDDAAPASTPGDTEASEGEEGESAGSDTEETESEEDDAAEPVEYQPLENVREEIRRALAQEMVAERLPDLMGEIHSELRQVYQAWEGKVFAAEDTGVDPPPAPDELVDLAPVAEKHGMEFQKTGKLSLVGLRDIPLGRSSNPSRFGRAELWQAEFMQLELYEPVLTYDLDFNHYIAVKVADEPEKVPTLDEIRDEVLRSWKLREASKVALRRAESLAGEAEDSGLTLREKFADDDRVEVTTTDPFSWLSIGNVSQTAEQVSFRMSEPAGVTAAGPDFMREVFGLGEGELGAVLNHDHSIAYVVRILDHQETPGELRSAFLNEADRWYGLPTMTNFHQRQGVSALVTHLTDSSNVDWLRPPDQPQSQ